MNQPPAEPHPRDLDRSNGAMPAAPEFHRTVPRFLVEPTQQTTTGTTLAEHQHQETVAPGDPLAELARLIREPPKVPQQGRDASTSMMKMFEGVALEIEKVASDATRRAEDFKQDALSYASMIRTSGHRLCDDLQSDAARLRSFALVMEEARRVFGGFSAPPPPGE